MAVDSDEAAKGSSLDAVERCLENAERFRHLNAFIRLNPHVEMKLLPWTGGTLMVSTFPFGAW